MVVCLGLLRLDPKSVAVSRFGAAGVMSALQNVLVNLAPPSEAPQKKSAMLGRSGGGVRGSWGAVHLNDCCSRMSADELPT